MTIRRFSFGVIVFLFLGTLLAGCGENEASICRSAEDFQLAVDQIRIEELSNALGAEFWQEIDLLLSEIADSDSGEIGILALRLREELKRFIVRLETFDYNLIEAALDPEATELFVTTAGDLLNFASGELRLAIDTQCQ